MILSDILPPSLLGFSSKELNDFNRLPWKSSKLENIDSSDNISFLLISGRIEINNKDLIGPGEELLGIKPFFKQVRRVYKTIYPNEIVYIETDKLAQFFLLNPMAMLSYMHMENNFGNEPLPRWVYLPKQWTILSDQNCFESIHLGLSIAEYQTQKLDTKAIYLEFQDENISVFNLIKKDPPPALTQTKEYTEGLAQLVEKRKIPLNERVDILNIHYLSMWKLSRGQWISLFWFLAKSYDDLIVHLGCKKIDFICDQSNCIFVTGSDILQQRSRPLFLMSQSPLVAIQRKDTENKIKKGIIEYPLKYSDLDSNKNIDSYLPSSHIESNPNWKWMQDNLDIFLDAKEAIVIADYFDNFAGFIATMKVLWKNIENSRKLNESLGKKVLILQGKSGILGGVAMESSNWEDFYDKCKRLVDYDVISVLKPIFPTTSLFSDKPIARYLKNLFPDMMQEKLKLFFPVITQETKNIHFLTSGSLAENLIKSTFIPGFVESSQSSYTFDSTNEENMVTLGATSVQDWIKILAACFRRGFKEVTMISFAQPQTDKNNIVAKKLLELRTSSSIFAGVSGRLSQTIHVPVSDKSQLSERQEEIYNTLKEIL